MSIKKTDEGLERVIGVSGLALTILNFTIGAGIFVLPAIIGIELGALGIFCYLFCAILLGAIMLCYAEIGSKEKIHDEIHVVPFLFLSLVHPN